MLYLSGSDIDRLLPNAAQLIDLVAGTLRDLHRGDAMRAPRATIQSDFGTRFMAFPAILNRSSVAGVKWLGTTDKAGSRNRGGSLIVLSNRDDATPFAVLDAKRITALRTAAVSLVAAQLLAAPESARISFIACGEQARLHLELFRLRYPLTTVRALSRSLSSAETFAADARAAGLHAEACTSVAECVRNADIVVCSAPSPSRELLRAEWLSPAAFCSLVDLGRTSDPRTFADRTDFYVDDVEQYRALTPGGFVAPFDAPPKALGALLTDEQFPLRCGGVFLPTGLGVADIAIAQLVHGEAVKRRVGVALN